MSLDERLAKLVEADERIRERHEALSQSLELLKLDTEQWITHIKAQDAKFDELRRSIVRGMVAFLQPENGHDGQGA
jgi:hypothetical protein